MATPVAAGSVVVRVNRQPAFAGRAGLRREFLRALDPRAVGPGERTFHFTGEPGIGKTRLLRELAAEAETRGWAVCWNRYSAGDWAPFGGIATGVIEALTRYGLLTVAELGAAASPLRAIAGYDDQERPPGASAPDGVLSSSLSRAVERLAAVRPTFFVFEDVDRADTIVRAAVSGLLRLAGERAVIATTGCEGGFGERDRQFLVTPLDEAEMGSLCQAATGYEFAPALLRRVHAAANGNPRAALDAVERLASTGQLYERNGQLLARSEDGLQARASDLERVETLAPEMKSVLGQAAIRGSSFRADELAPVAGGTAAGSLLETACELGIVVAVNSHYEFRSDSIREAVIATVPTEQRERAHRAIATEVQSRPGSQANVLAVGYHLANAGGAARPETDIEPLALAGELSFRASAWTDAVRYFEVALRHAKSGAADDRQTAWLEGRLGWSHYRNLDTAAAHAFFASSYEWFREAREIHGWADSLDGMLAVQTAHTDLSRPTPLALAEEFLVAAEGHLYERSYLLSQYSEMLYRNGDDRALAAAEEALALAEESEDPFLQHRAQFALGLATLRVLEVERASAAFEESAAFARVTGDVKREGIALQNLVPILVATGRFAEAKVEAERALCCADAVSDWAVRSFAGALLASIAVAEGEFDDADAFATDSQAAYLRSHIGWTPPVLYSSIAYSRILRGRAVDAMDLLDMLVEKVGKGFAWPLRALAQVETTDREALREEAERRFQQTAGRPLDLFSFTPIAAWALLAKELDLPGVGIRAAEMLVRCHSAGLRFGLGPAISLSRAMADWDGTSSDAATRECEMAGARAELAQALADSAPTRALALTREIGMRHLAARLETREPVVADDAEFDVLRLFAAGFEPGAIAERLMLSLTRVERVLTVLAPNQTAAAAGLRLQETRRMDIEAAPRRPAESSLNGTPGGARRVPLVALFTDIENSTAVNHAVGDEAWVVALAEHDAIVRGEIVRAGGTVIKSGGDGFFAVFDSVDGALLCSETIQRRFPLTVRHHPAFAIRVRAGIHCGAAYLVNADYHGVDVTLAARLCAWGKAGQTLVSDAVRRRAGRPRFEFVSCGRAILKGFEDPVAIYEAINLGGK